MLTSKIVSVITDTSASSCTVILSLLGILSHLCQCTFGSAACAQLEAIVHKRFTPKPNISHFFETAKNHSFNSFK